MASDAYLLIDGVTGESQAQGMTNNIELDSFSFGASNPADVGGKGLSAGKCSLSDFSCTFGVDQASYQILKNLHRPAHCDMHILAARVGWRCKSVHLPDGDHDQLLHHQ